MFKFASLIVLACLACNEPGESWSECQGPAHPVPVADGLSIQPLGTVVTMTGEVCRVEEIVQYYPCVKGNRCTDTRYDQEHRCKYQEGSARTLMRRMVCPNSTSTSSIDHDNKHREIIQ